MVLTTRISVQEWQRHAAAHPWIGEKKTSEYIEHPVCPHCERIALRGNGTKGSWGKDRIATCPSCGWRGHAPTIMREYVEDGLYR